MALQTNSTLFGMRRRPRYSARPFALTILAISTIALLAWAKSEYAQNEYSVSRAPLLTRDVATQDLECRLVHRYPRHEQCAFVLANCPDEEAGIFSYLSLYYCRLARAKAVAFAILVLWLGLLFSTIGIAASDFFCVNLSTISALLGMSESLAGVTFLAFGNGSPDVFSTFAAFNTNSASLAMGELIGAAGFITAVVAGSMALVRPFKVARRSFVRDLCFFIVAASFSMAFIWDGKLALWESATMVGFYIFYVCFVMVSHYWIGRRKARKLRAATMRSHYILPGGEEEEIAQEYHDEDDGPANQRRLVSVDDFAVLEAAGHGDSIEADDNEAMRERWLGELNNNMRVSRPPLGSRRNTHNPIRPSLVGALEFRAVLSSLQKSRNIQSMPINLRRYSDDPTYTTAQQQEAISGDTNPAPRPPYEISADDDVAGPLVSRPTSDVQRHMRNRIRAVSTNDMENTRLDPDILHRGSIPTIDFDPATPDERWDQGPVLDQPPPSPTISLSPPPSSVPSRSTSPVPGAIHPSPNMLAPPGLDAHGAPGRAGTATPSPLSSPNIAPEIRSATRAQPKLVIPSVASSAIPFPAYIDYPGSAHSSRAPSLLLPSPSASAESYFHGHYFPVGDRAKVPRWWPSQLLPAPDVIVSTLFPTLTNWREKNIWEKMLGVVAAPSVFLLTITLPVVETQRDDEDEMPMSPGISLAGPLTPASESLHSRQRSAASSVAAEHPSGTMGFKPTVSTSTVGHGRTGSSGTLPANPPLLRVTEETSLLQSPEQLPTASPSSDSKAWNRWLVVVQSFTAPFFIVLMIWANTEGGQAHALLRHTLYSLLFSMCMLALLLATTTPQRAPRWRTALIFAVGNSLGDFVADITVARLGFPVMALSACFGGPMLNILLGIGVSGSYMSIKGGQHRHEKHPNKPIHFKPYLIDVSTTLIISGATLLVTLAGLLLAVPMRRWRMDRTIGWGLVALWCVSTVVNVVVELVGLSSNMV